MRFSSVRRAHLTALAAVLACSLPGIAAAQAKIKVAAIYTVPFEQQWVQPHPQGAEGGRGARRDRVRVLARTSPTPTTSA